MYENRQILSEIGKQEGGVTMAIQLKAKTRDNSKKSILRRLREEGNVPAVIYGKDTNSTPIYVDNIDFTKILRESGRNGIITLAVENRKHSVMVSDLQIDTLKSSYIHADFLEVDLNTEIDAEVPVHLVGDPAGVKEGGVLQHFVREVSVRALPSELPPSFEINVEELNIGDSISVSGLDKASSYEVTNDPDEIIVSVTPPTLEEDEDSVEEEEQEPELVNDKGDSDDDEKKA
jgi:large subunit ribosomal protein L25